MTHVIGSGEMPDPEMFVRSSGKHDPIAYVYEADHHCPECAEKRFGRDEHGDITGTDGEGNEVGVIAPWDEWIQGTGEPETLGCSDCGRVIAEHTMTEPGEWEA